MSKGRLTRQELGWLLTQEAQGAAERLRKGVSALTQAPPPPGADPSGVDATLSVLDDTMKMLSSLHARPVGLRGRRGRIDLASLLWEVAPEARVSIEPGSGTEVFGDEAELRRMLHVMLGHGSSSGSAVTIKGDGDEVVVGVMLGPDSSATSETERAWLARMAVRYGGRYELDGSMEVLGLPAEGIESRGDLAKLRKELDEARKQGEAYARELAAVWAAGDEPIAPSTYPPPATPALDRVGAIARLSGGIAASLRAMLSPAARELADLRTQTGPRKSSPDLDATARGEVDERLETIRRRLLSVQEFVAELAAVGEGDALEPAREVDLVEMVRGEVRILEARALRAGVEVRVRTVPDEPRARVISRVAPRLAAVLARELVAYAIAATPRGSGVVVTVVAGAARGDDQGLGARIVVDDAGTILPGSARRALLALEVEPGTFGRPSSVSLFVAAELAAALGALLELSDAVPETIGAGLGPAARGLGGGVRVVVTFPR
ncbi:MAG TPA: sensor histidine kinase [Polyangiaceae bacterium]|nr:sensor histidine kinase [Polyangiaceae bacterium]